MKLTRILFLLVGLCAAGVASATVQQHNFTLSGPGGITGTGYFTYDDNVVGPGELVADCGDGPCTFDNSIYFEFTITGGVAGPGVTFTKADCGSPGAGLGYAPDFTFDINFFDCDNGAGFTGVGVDYFTFELSGGASPVDITFAPGTTVALPSEPVPTLPLAALALLAIALGWLGYRRLTG